MPRTDSKNAGKGFIRLNRSDETIELLKYPMAFVLLSVISLRAKRSANTFTVQQLEVGECVLGDHNNYGMKEHQYRAAKQILENCRLVEFRTTNKGTIAKLIDKRIFDINVEKSAGETSDRTLSKNEQETTNNNKNNSNNLRSVALQKNQDGSSDWILEEIARVAQLPSLDGTLRENKQAAVRLMQKICDVTNNDLAKAQQNIIAAIEMAARDPFHSKNFTSVMYLERHIIKILKASHISQSEISNGFIS